MKANICSMLKKSFYLTHSSHARKFLRFCVHKLINIIIFSLLGSFLVQGFFGGGLKEHNTIIIKKNMYF